MPSLRIELNDDDCNVDESEAISFAIPVGKKKIFKKMKRHFFDFISHSR